MDTSLLQLRSMSGLEYTVDGIDRALKYYSGDVEKFLVHALVEDQMGLEKDAGQSLAHALRLEPKNPLGLALKGDFLSRQGKHKEALKVLRNAVLTGPNEWFAESTLGAVLWAKDEYDEALGHLALATAEAPRHALPYARLGEARRLMSEPDEALLAFRAAKVRAPRSAWVLERMADVYRLRGDLDDGLEALERANEIANLTAFGWGTRGDILRQLGNLDEAAEAFDRSVGLDEKDPFVIAWRADVLHTLGRVDEALAGVETALEIDPRLWFGWGIKGEILRDQKQFMDAGQSFEKALTLAPSPNNGWLLYWSGLVHLETGEHSRAIDELFRSLEDDPDDQLARRVLARSLLEAGRSEEALAEAKAAHAIDTEEPWAQSALGDAFASTGNRDEAEMAYRRSLTLLDDETPGTEDVWLVGWNRLHLEEYEAALSALLDQLSATPDETGLDLDFALATLCSGRHDAGLAEYFRAVAAGVQREEKGRLKGLLHSARFDLEMSISYHHIEASSQLSQIVELLANGAEALAKDVPKIEALWVDDYPANNLNESLVISNQFGVRFSTATDTDEAIAKLTANPNRFAFAITDMARGFDRSAGLTLIRRIHEAGINLPTIIYAASTNEEREADAKRVGAIAITNSPSRLLQLVSDVVSNVGPTTSPPIAHQNGPSESATVR